jgi:hypothetical protein
MARTKHIDRTVSGKIHTGPTLSAQDLQEFQFRQATLNRARHTYMMVQESYQGWIKSAAIRYGFSGEITISMVTGEIQAVVKPSNG